MNCEDCLEMMTRYMDGDLPSSLMEAIGSHLESCQGCRQRYEGVSLVLRKVEGEERVGLPPHFLPKLISALDDVQGAPALGRLVPRLAIGLAPILVILSLLIFRERRPASDLVLEEPRLSEETIYLSPLDSEEKEVFTLRGRTPGEERVLYLLPSSSPKVKATVTSY